MAISKSDTAELLAYLAAGLQGSTHRLDVTPAVVEVWHRQFARNRVGHRHIVLAAIDDHMGSDASRYGVVPADIITRYKSLTRRIAGRTSGWELMGYTQRQAILGDPAEVDYSQGIISAAQYQDQRQTPAAITAGPPNGDDFATEAQRRGLPNMSNLGRMA